jgi:hypothetical protein
MAVIHPLRIFLAIIAGAVVSAFGRLALYGEHPRSIRCGSHCAAMGFPYCVIGESV